MTCSLSDVCMLPRKVFLLTKQNDCSLDLQENLLIKGLTDIHIYHRYDVSGLDVMRLLKRLKI